MRAAVFHGAGDVRIEDRADPATPAAGEVAIAVLRASVCGTDAAEYAHGPVLVPAQAGPLVLGHEFVGRVVGTGPGVTEPPIGRRVVCGAGVSCGRCSRCAEGRTNLCLSYYTVGLQADGGLAERVVVPAATCASVPDACSDDAAALAQPMAVAVHALDRGAVAPDAALVVHGAGGIGAFAVAAAVARGGHDIIAVDVDPHRLATARRLGACETIDARSTDPVARVRELTDGSGADVVIEASGAPAGPQRCIEMTRPGGRVVLLGLQKAPVALDLLALTLREIDVVPTVAHVCATDLPEALEILADGTVADAVVDRVIALEALVPAGLEPIAAGRVRGKVLVDPSR
jgi:(R,R)-butanediol dehydrogenase / meso-butanediol dehydrogenase / diacetyl reductase